MHIKGVLEKGLVTGRGIARSARNLGGTGQDSTSTYKCDKDTMAASVPITQGLNNNSRGGSKDWLCTLANNRQDVA